MKFNDYIDSIICIYKITNTKTNKILIGSTTNLHKRIIQYKYDIIHQRNKCLNDNFLNDVILYGIDSLTIDIIEQFDNIDNISLKNKETYYIELYNSLNENIGYNIRLDFDGKYICNDSTKKLKSEQLKEQWNNGIRDEHGNTMKNYWQNASKERINKQREILRKNITKYLYNIYDLNNNLLQENIEYCKLCNYYNIFPKNVTSRFCQKEKELNKNNKSIIKIPCNKIVYRNQLIIERIKVNKN